MRTGKRGPFPLGIPRAGVSDKDIAEARRFGAALSQRLNSDQPLDETVWQGLGAVAVRDKLIPSETVASLSFYLWGTLFLACGGSDASVRNLFAIVYLIFFVAMILI